MAQDASSQIREGRAMGSGAWRLRLSAFTGKNGLDQAGSKAPASAPAAKRYVGWKNDRKAMNSNVLITVFLIASMAIALQGLIRFNQERTWTTTYGLLAALTIARAGLEIYKKTQHIKLGSFYHALGDFTAGIMVGIVLAAGLTQTKKRRQERQEQRPPNQAL
jgi:hypothetical protein